MLCGVGKDADNICHDPSLFGGYAVVIIHTTGYVEVLVGVEVGGCERVDGRAVPLDRFDVLR